VGEKIAMVKRSLDQGHIIHQSGKDILESKSLKIQAQVQEVEEKIENIPKNQRVPTQILLLPTQDLNQEVIRVGVVVAQ
jgi:folate-dependent phosphoribosylglycinamide formyltransferase PurN